MRLRGGARALPDHGNPRSRRGRPRRSGRAVRDPPGLVPDFIALRGDPSDGIPGAKGVGAKTAADLLREHGSLEGVLEHAIRETRPALRKNLLGARDDLLAFKDMATLRDAGVKRPPDAPTDWKGGAAAAERLGMNRLAERLRERLS